MIKYSFAVIFSLLGRLAMGQVNDSFSDGNFSLSPKWFGDTTAFIVNNSNELQSQGPNSGSPIYLCTESKRIENTVWEFLIKLPFASSTTNYAKVFLATDSFNLKSSLHGYYLKIGGESGSTDGIDLYKQNGITNTKLIDGIAGHAGKNSNTLRIKVSRDNIGNWNLYSDTLGGVNYTLEGNCIDSSYTKSGFAGVIYYYSSTRRNQFYFDDFKITQAPLSVISASAINESEIEILFNNPLKPTIAEETLHYLLGDLGNPSKVILQSPNCVRLTFPTKLLNNWYTVELRNLTDDSGGLLVSGEITFYFQKPFKFGDIIITELLADPSPTNGLPEYEFVELYNTTPDSIPLGTLTFSDPTTQTKLPQTTLAPYSYIILTSSESKSSYQSYGQTLGLIPWPSLNNSGDVLHLKDEHNLVIFNLSYSDKWYGNPEKTEGGWSLEMINPEEICKENFNWTASINPSGGTPGYQNSVFSTSQDTTSPVLTYYELSDSNLLTLRFNKPLDTLLKDFDFSCGENEVTKFQFYDQQTILVKWEKAYLFNKEYSIRCTKIRDCLGNSTAPFSITIIRPAKADSMDIVINEILFNPKPEGVDFVELYNRSDNFIDLKGWQLASTKSGTIEKKLITDFSYILRPNQYIVLCSSLEILENQFKVYYPERVLVPASMPSFNDDEGTVSLFNSTGKQIDFFSYKEDFHSKLLQNIEGVSLERISFFAESNNSNNWYSASSGSGYGTPGYENSQHFKEASSKEITIEPNVISPNGDNYKDLSYIHYHFPKTGNSCSIKIFNSTGKLIRRLVENQLTGETGFFVWDGTNEMGAPVETGIYIIHIENFNTSGDVSSNKETIVVVSEN